ncbi:MAG TPA: hypothetical protein VH253_11410 [Phycisphaerae bacterium]|nr:hypothetical protein [Phycisphaerae bacterium]
MAKPPPGTLPQQQADAYGIPGMRRHLLLCAGPDCVAPEQGDAAWNYLKKRIAELKLDRAPTRLFRTRCHCLRICTAGPILVVQPDGTWYARATPEVIERVLQEHVLGGRVVSEHLFACAPLPSDSTITGCGEKGLEPIGEPVQQAPRVDSPPDMRV